jgi:GcrA cell cycle regulator
MLNNVWSVERIEQLKKLYADGYSCAQIAGHLGHATRNAVIGKVHRLGLTRDSRRVPKAGPRAPREAKKSAARPAGNIFEARWQPKKPAEPIAIRCAAVEPFHLSEPEVGKCKYPYGDGPFTFCGHDTARTYCDLHHELCWVAPVRRSGPLAPFPNPPTTRPKAAFMRVGGAPQ